jgi:hypothetical protein
VTKTEFCAPKGWELVNGIVSTFTLPKYHPGGEYDLRTPKADGKPGQQCIYDKNGKLINKGPAAGTPDRRGPGAWGGNDHMQQDGTPYELALQLDCSDPSNPNTDGEHYKKYMEVRNPNKGKRSDGTPCPDNPS